MHAATSPDVASSNRCRFDQPHRSVNHRHGPLAGGTNTSLEVKDLRDPRSQREREKTVGELLRRGMEGINMKDNTGNIKRGRETEKVQCRQQNGIWQERAWHPLIKL